MLTYKEAVFNMTCYRQYTLFNVFLHLSNFVHTVMKMSEIRCFVFESVKVGVIMLD